MGNAPAKPEEEDTPIDPEGKLYRAKPHLDAQEQALVKRLMDMYPRLDQLMAESIVWDYMKKKETRCRWLDEAIPFKGGTLPHSYVTDQLQRTLTTHPTDAHTWVADAPPTEQTEECSAPSSGTSSGAGN